MVAEKGEARQLGLSPALHRSVGKKEGGEREFKTKVLLITFSAHHGHGAPAQTGGSQGCVVFHPSPYVAAILFARPWKPALLPAVGLAPE